MYEIMAVQSMGPSTTWTLVQIDSIVLFRKIVCAIFKIFNTLVVFCVKSAQMKLGLMGFGTEKQLQFRLIRQTLWFRNRLLVLFDIFRMVNIFRLFFFIEQSIAST